MPIFSIRKKLKRYLSTHRLCLLLLHPSLASLSCLSVLMVLKNQTIDDRDTNTIHYQGGWFNQGTYNATSVGTSGTLSSTNDPNANFTVDTPPTFAFYYFGIERSRGGFYQICIDCDPLNRIWLDIDALNRTDDGKNPPVVLFSQRWTSPQSHEIIVTNRPDTRFPDGNSQITLDALVYTIDDGAPAPPDTPSTITSISISTKSTTGITSPAPGATNSTSSTTNSIASTTNSIASITNSPSSTTNSIPGTMGANASSSSLSSHPSTGNGSKNGSSSNGTLVIAIAPSVIGGVLLFLLGVFFIFRCRRRRSALSALSKPSPFQLSTAEAVNTAIDLVPSSGTNEESPFVSQYSTEKVSNPKRVPTHTPSTTTPITQNTSLRSPPNLREEDAGSIHGLSNSGETLPPDYDDATRNRQRL